MSAGCGGEREMRIAEGSGRPRFVVAPTEGSGTTLLGRGSQDRQIDAVAAAIVDTPSSGCTDVGPRCRRCEGRDGGRRAGQRPGRAVAIVIASPARARHRRRSSHGPVQLGPGSPATSAHARSHPRIVWRGPRGCPAWEQPPSCRRIRPAHYGQTPTPTWAVVVPPALRVHGDSATSHSGR